MLVMSKGALSVGQAETYYQEKYSEDDYYTESHRVTGQWYGRAAETLGLSGAVSEEDFRAVLRGTRPGSGEVLVSAAAGRDDRRAGWDATFNAPKSVSIQALVGEDSRLVEAHRRAVERALSELEQFAQARRHRGQEWVTTGNFVAARFEHIAARPSETGTRDGYGPDPHLHTHVVIANMTLRPDGRWRSLDPIEIYRSQSFATAVYRSELGREVQALGYRISVTAADGRWELQEYTREQVMAFSRRRQDIEALLSRQNSTGAAAAQIAAHQSRLAKESRNENELRAEWKDARPRQSNRSRRDFGTRASTRPLAGGFSGWDRGSGQIQRSSQHRTRSRYRPARSGAHRSSVRDGSRRSRRRAAGDRRAGITWRSNRPCCLLFVSGSRLHHPGDGGGGGRKP